MVEERIRLLIVQWSSNRQELMGADLRLFEPNEPETNANEMSMNETNNENRIM